MPSNHALSGFSLMQVSIILAASSIVLAATLPGDKADSYGDKEAITQQRMYAIELATKNFMAKNYRRPCPASGASDRTQDTFGVEVNTPGNCTADFGPTSGVVAGVVPVRTLELPDEYALDGYGRRFMYVVDNNATSKLKCRSAQSFHSTGAIAVLDGYAGTIARDYTMWALISYGKDGHGAFPTGGSSVANRVNTYTTDSNTLYNAFVDSGFTTSFTGKVVASSYSTSYDDKVWYDQSTKNTCCIGTRCSQGFRVTTEATGLDSMLGVTHAIGDINADGIDDIVYANYQDTDGEIKVIYGAQNGWPVAPTAKVGVTTAYYVIDNDYGETYTGASLAVGDVNGDGKADILVNATGYAYIIYGITSKATGTYLMSTLVTGGQATRILHGGTGIPGPVAIGNVDGDSYNDLLITPFAIERYLYIVYGKAAGSWAGTINALTSYTNSALLYSGSARAWASLYTGLSSGDINGDGYDDIIGGGPVDTAAASGTVSILYGRKRTSWPAVDPNVFEVDAQHIVGTTTTGAIFQSSLAGETFVGQSVVVADMNNDGYKDIVTTSTHSIYGISGKSGNFSAYPSNVLNTGAASFRIDTTTNRPAGATNLASFYNIISIGDVNNDGLRDIILSCANTTLSHSHSGTAYVLFAPTIANGWAADGFAAQYTASPPMYLFSATSSGYDNFLTGYKGFLIEGQVNDYMNSPRMGDFNGDKYTDLVIRAPGYDGSSITGALYVIMGRNSEQWNSRYDSTVTTLPIIDGTDFNQ